jgi:hypothetical protein
MRLPVIDLIIDLRSGGGRLAVLHFQHKRRCPTAPPSAFQRDENRLMISVSCPVQSSKTRGRGVSHLRGPAPIEVRSVPMCAPPCYPPPAERTYIPYRVKAVP